MQFPITYDFIKEDSSKEQVIKILEETAELLEADKTDDYEHILEEALDVFQALSNYCEMLFTQDELQHGYDRVFLKNWKRGYYHKNLSDELYKNAEQHAKTLEQNLNVRHS